MNFLRLCAVILLLCWSTTMVFALEDFIAPTKIFFQVKPGEKLSYDMSYISGIGGTYDLSSRVFRYDERGEKQFVSDSSGFVSFPQAVFEFIPGQQHQVTVNVIIPPDSPDGDMLISHYLRRRTEEQQTFELGSLMYLRVGADPDFKGEVSDVGFHFLPEESSEAAGRIFDAVTFNFQNQSNRFFSITPAVSLFDVSGKLLSTLENKPIYVFPEFKKQAGAYNFSPKDVEFSAPIGRAELQVLDENGRMLHREDLLWDKDNVFQAQREKKSPFQDLKIRKGILYNPIFQISAIAIGLTFIAFSLLMRRK